MPFVIPWGRVSREGYFEYFWGGFRERDISNTFGVLEMYHIYSKIDIPLISRYVTHFPISIFGQNLHTIDIRGHARVIDGYMVRRSQWDSTLTASPYPSVKRNTSKVLQYTNKTVSKRKKIKQVTSKVLQYTNKTVSKRKKIKQVTTKVLKNTNKTVSKRKKIK